MTGKEFLLAGSHLENHSRPERCTHPAPGYTDLYRTYDGGRRQLFGCIKYTTSPKTTRATRARYENDDDTTAQVTVELRTGFAPVQELSMSTVEV